MNFFSPFVLMMFPFVISAQIFVSTTGDNGNPGTFEEPLAAIPAAVTLAGAGDTIYIMGGTYSLTTTITISKDGNPDNRYYLFAYGVERPVLDFSSMPVNSTNRGVRLSGDYWHIKGIDIKGAGDNGMNISGSNNIVEFCSFYENRDTGLQLGGGASDNRIINCDSYFNADPDNGDADGFAPKLDVGSNNYFYGCRAWQNSDDGWDGYMRGADDVTTIVENSWCFSNGYLKNGSASSGNGNGYKMGGSDDRTLMHNFTLVKSIAFDNRVKGFDQNNNKGSMTLYNCTAYRNGTNYSIPSSLNTGKTAAIINSAALGSFGSLGAFVVQQTNSWLAPFAVSAADFVSIDTAGVRGPRKPDGSLPDILFLNLAGGSDLINGGTDVGLPYAGAAPDLGAFEYGVIIPVELLAFSAEVSGNSIILKWSAGTETNNYGFEVQKKISGADFNTIGFVKGAGTSSVKNEYSFSDKNNLQGIYVYRLKQVDFNGTFSYSNELMVNYNQPRVFTLLQNYPNPFNPSTIISFSLSAGGKITVEIFNLLGESLALPINEQFMEAGLHQVRFDASSLPSGTYIYVLRQGGNFLSRKMTLIK